MNYWSITASATLAFTPPRNRTLCHRHGINATLWPGVLISVEVPKEAEERSQQTVSVLFSICPYRQIWPEQSNNMKKLS